METPELTSADYWESDAIDLRVNPRRDVDTGGLVRFLEDRGVKSAVVMATSGSSGGFKFVVLPKRALLASAEAVVRHCGLHAGDVWLAGLSDFHVGGLGIFSRSYLAGSRVERMPGGRWKRDGSTLVEGIRRHGATLTAMTPTHLYDLVENNVRCPAPLRGALLGGGRIDPSLVDAAVGLGWPVWPSYGMTEAGSQVATSLEGEAESLPILSTWETRTAEDGRFALRGPALFSGYAVKREGRWTFDEARDTEGWFLTGDRCELEGNRLRFLGRADDLIKISGELVSLAELDHRAERIGRRYGAEAAIIPILDPRRENGLLLVVAGDRDQADRIFEDYNRDAPGLVRAARVKRIDEMPRTEIGKVDRRELGEG